MTESSALSRVMDQAQAAADATPATSNASTSLVTQNNTSGGTSLARPSLTSLVDSAGITVDDFLEVKQAGFRLGDMKGYFQEMTVELDMSEVVPIFQVRATTAAGVTTFIKSYDGARTSSGENFQQAINHLRATHQGGKVDGPYETSEIPVKLLESVTDGKVTVAEDTLVGITPPITGVKFFAKFLKRLAAEGLEDAVVKAKVVHAPQSNTKGHEWGVAAFELIEKISD